MTRTHLLCPLANGRDAGCGWGPALSGGSWLGVCDAVGLGTMSGAAYPPANMCAVYVIDCYSLEH